MSHHQVPHLVLISVLVLLAAGTMAKPSHFPAESTNQLVIDGDAQNLVDSGLKPWQMELLAQRLYEYFSQQQQQQPSNEMAWERSLRSPENKRQSRYRQCYFNPISCFRK